MNKTVKSLYFMVVLHKFMIGALLIKREQHIKLKTADIHKAYKLKLPDAIIAATARVYDLTLPSRDVAALKNRQGLRLITPRDQ